MIQRRVSVPCPCPRSLAWRTRIMRVSPRPASYDYQRSALRRPRRRILLPSAKFFVSIAIGGVICDTSLLLTLHDKMEVL